MRINICGRKTKIYVFTCFGNLELLAGSLLDCPFLCFPLTSASKWFLTLSTKPYSSSTFILQMVYLTKPKSPSPKRRAPPSQFQHTITEVGCSTLTYCSNTAIINTLDLQPAILQKNT